MHLGESLKETRPSDIMDYGLLCNSWSDHVPEHKPVLPSTLYEKKYLPAPFLVLSSLSQIEDSI